MRKLQLNPAAMIVFNALNTLCGAVSAAADDLYETNGMLLDVPHVMGHSGDCIPTTVASQCYLALLKTFEGVLFNMVKKLSAEFGFYLPDLGKEEWHDATPQVWTGNPMWPFPARPDNNIFSRGPSLLMPKNAHSLVTESVPSLNMVEC